MTSWWFEVTFLGWLSDPFKCLSDLQLGDQKVTLNHLDKDPYYNGSVKAGVYGSHGSIAPRTFSLAKFAQVCVPGVAEALVDHGPDLVLSTFSWCLC